MKIICEKENLVKAISAATKAVPTKTTLPILKCFLITTDNSSITVTGNNMELSIESKLDADITESGKIAVNAKTFENLVKSLPEGDVELESDEVRMELKIKSGKTKFKVRIQDATNYPDIQQVNDIAKISILQDVFRNLVKRTIFSISENENNKIMTGGYLEIDGAKLSLTTLDGHRISIAKAELSQNFDKISAIIPGKTLSDISKISSGGKDINISFDKNFVRFEFDENIVVSRTIEGTYFNVNQLITNKFETVIDANRADFAAAINRAVILVANDERKPVVLDIADNNMNISMRTITGDLDETMDIVQNGADIKISFNPRFFFDIFKVIDDETINISFLNPKSPCTIKDANETYTYILLPVSFN